MMGRALFFVLGVLVGAVAVFFYITRNHNLSIVPDAPMPALTAPAPKLITPPQVPIPAPTKTPAATPPTPTPPAPIPQGATSATPSASL